MKRNNRIGGIIPNGVSLEKHESDTVVFFTNLGYTIELIPPSLTPDSKTPDFLMDGQEWEMKSPTGKSKNTVERSFRKAAKQSANIIIDLRRLSMDQEKVLESCEKLFNASNRVRKMKIITKGDLLKEYNK